MSITVTRARGAWFEATEVPFQRQPLRVQFKRLTIAEKVEFRVDFQAYQRASQRGVPVRQPGEEQMSDGEVWTRRLLESADARQKDRERALELNRESLAFVQRTFAQYVRICPGGLVDEAGDAVLEGADLFEVGQDDEELLGAVVVGVFVANELADDLKKKLPSPYVLMRSSRANGAAVPSGDEPDATVENAAPSTSAESEAATALNGSVPSGSMSIS
jgi:hypothetical protein